MEKVYSYVATYGLYFFVQILVIVFPQGVNSDHKALFHDLGPVEREKQIYKPRNHYTLLTKLK